VHWPWRSGYCAGAAHAASERTRRTPDVSGFVNGTFPHRGRLDGTDQHDDRAKCLIRWGFSGTRQDDPGPVSGVVVPKVGGSSPLGHPRLSPKVKDARRCRRLRTGVTRWRFVLIRRSATGSPSDTPPAAADRPKLINTRTTTRGSRPALPQMAAKVYALRGIWSILREGDVPQGQGRARCNDRDLHHWGNTQRRRSWRHKPCAGQIGGVFVWVEMEIAAGDGDLREVPNAR
jgi:hypothetical protein